MRKVIVLIITFSSILTTFAKPDTFEGIASYYGSYFHGRKTASGELYNQYKLTAAHKTLPLGTVVKVTNLSNSKSVFVKINDRGPYVKGRVIDVSTKAADLLGFKNKGTTKVSFEVVEPEEVPIDLSISSEALAEYKKDIKKDTASWMNIQVVGEDEKKSEPAPMQTPVNSELNVNSEGMLNRKDLDSTKLSILEKVTAGYFGIDLGNFFDLTELKELIKLLLSKYQHPIYFDQIANENNQPTYKLFMGNYKNKAYADALQLKLAADFKNCAVVQW